MTSKARKPYKKILVAACLLFLLFNLVAINHAYHLTHFYEHGTVRPLAEQANGFWGKDRVALSGLKQEKLIGAVPDSAFTNVKLKSNGKKLLGSF
jgi:hypothetical protein